MMASRKRGAITRAASGETSSFGVTSIDAGTKRLTVDLDGQTRADLGVWAAQQSAEHRANVSVAPAVRVLLTMLMEDDALSERVVERIKAGEGAR